MFAIIKVKQVPYLAIGLSAPSLSGREYDVVAPGWDVWDIIGFAIELVFSRLVHATNRW
jgi:hypothetical protein